MFAILSIVVLILLTTVSYSSGITLAAKRKDYPLGVIDLMVTFGLWVIVFGIRPQISHIPLLVAAVGLGLAAGALVGTVRLSRFKQTNVIPKSELPEHVQETPSKTAVSNRWIRNLWQRWSDFAGRMGRVQSQLLMGFFYFFIVTPFGLITRLFSDPLTIRKSPEKSNWQVKESTEITIEAAQEQG